MPNPTIGDVHVQSALSDVSVAYMQAQDNFIADIVAPIIPVQKQADKYFVYDRQDLLRSDARPRAPGTQSAGGGVRISTDTYFCDRVALHQDVDDPTRANTDPAINLDADATEYITSQIALKKEKDWVTAFFATGIWDGASSTSDMTGAAAPASTATGFRFWSDVASTPIEDIRGEIVSVAKRTGRRPNTLVLGPQVWAALVDHPDILDRIKNTNPGAPATINQQLLAALFELDEVMVLRAVKNSGPEGGTDSVDFMAGKSALLLYAAPNPGLRTVSAGYTFTWTGAGAPLTGARIKRYRDEPIESDIIEGETWTDSKQVVATLGGFFATAVA